MRGHQTTRQRGHKRASTLWFVTAALYLLLAASTIHFTSHGGTIATVWPANAVLVALLTTHGAPRWLTVLSAGLAGNLAANWLTRHTVSGPLLYSIANGLEVVVAVRMLRAKLGRFDLLRSTNLLTRFIIVAGIVAPAVSALVGGATAALIYDQPFRSSLATWFISDSLGLLVFTPVFRSAWNGEYAAALRTQTLRRRLEALGLIGIPAATAIFVFFVADLPTLFLLYAPVMLVTFRLGPLGTKLAVLLIAVTGAFATALGQGPIVMVTGDAVSQALLFQASLAVMLLTCLPVAAEVSRRNHLADELRAREQAAVNQAHTDPLTGVLNRRGFERRARAALVRPAEPLCCVAIDVDRFKAINDRWGHPFGDAVLRHLASVLRANIRPDDLLGRLGGDEFMLILRSDVHTAEAICTRIQSALRTSPVADAKIGQAVAISCGIAPVAPSECFESAARRADAMLYEAKTAGRNATRSAAH